MLRQLQSRTAIASRHVSLIRYSYLPPGIRFISSSPYRVNISESESLIRVKEVQKQGYRDIHYSENEYTDMPLNYQGDEISNSSSDLRSHRLYTSDRIYVANLPYDVVPEDVMKAFEEFGVSKVQLRTNEGQKFPAGDAFVTFHTVDGAAAAYNSTKTFDLFCKGRKLRIGSANATPEARKQLFYPTDTLFVTGFTPAIPSVKAVVRKVLPPEWSSHVIFHSHRPRNSTTDQVYGFIVFDSIQSCQQVKEILDEYIQGQPGFPFKVNYAKSHRSTQRAPVPAEHLQWTEEDEGNVYTFDSTESIDRKEFITNNPSLTKTIFIGNVPLETTARDLREVFQGFGIFAIWISVDREGKSRGFARLKCKSLDDAANILLTSKKRDFTFNGQTLELDFARQEFYGTSLPSTKLHVANFNETIKTVNAVVETILPPEFSSLILDVNSYNGNCHGSIEFKDICHAKEALDLILKHGRDNPRDAIHVEYESDPLNDALSQI